MRLDILTKLNNKKRMWLTPKHPLFFESTEFKIIYSAAVFMHVELNKSNQTLNNFELERLLTKGLGLSSKEVSEVIKLAKGGERIVDDVLEILNTPIKTYLFILDLANVGATEVSQEERQSIDIFAELLKLSQSKKKLLLDFISCATEADSNKCTKGFEQMLKEGMGITMAELKYYVPDMEYVTNIGNKTIKSGETLRLVDNCVLKETLVVPAGAVLDIENAQVHIMGTIIVDGGKVIINDSQLINGKKENIALIYIKNFSEIEIYNSTIHCRSMGSAINQENGNLKIVGSKIYNTSGNSSIKFWGNQILIEDTLFKNCYSSTDGGALQVLRGSGLVKDCIFEECEARNGGAVYTTNELMIQNCRFKCCYVIEFGAGVYCKGEIKSNLTDCEFYECYPKNEEVIQYIGGIEDKTINRELVIKVATILDRPVRVTDLGILKIEDTIVYMNHSIQCSGILHIRNSKIRAWDFKKRDLFIVEHSRGCLIENSEFDGRVIAGIFRITGTRLHAQHCLFRNTSGGRAIYDAYEPLIRECIFSYCLGGAVNCYSGIIENSNFINCRAKSGAGILLYGSKGEIDHCHFMRCVSEYSGGAVDMTRGNHANHCVYEECKPDNIAY